MVSFVLLHIRCFVSGRLGIYQAMGKTIVAMQGARLTKKDLKPKQPFHMSDAEKSIARRLHFDNKMPPSQVATTLGRDRSAVCRLLRQKRMREQ